MTVKVEHGALVREDGTRWALPLADLEWRLRYAPDRGAELAAAEVMGAWRSFLARPLKLQAELVRELREAVFSPAEGKEGERDGRFF